MAFRALLIGILLALSLASVSFAADQKQNIVLSIQNFSGDELTISTQSTSFFDVNLRNLPESIGHWITQFPDHVTRNQVVTGIVESDKNQLYQSILITDSARMVYQRQMQCLITLSAGNGEYPFVVNTNTTFHDFSMCGITDVLDHGDTKYVHVRLERARLL